METSLWTENYTYVPYLEREHYLDIFVSRFIRTLGVGSGVVIGLFIFCGDLFFLNILKSYISNYLMLTFFLFTSYLLLTRELNSLSFNSQMTWRIIFLTLSSSYSFEYKFL
jgi:hypothetical protein